MNAQLKLSFVEGFRPSFASIEYISGFGREAKSRHPRCLFSVSLHLQTTILNFPQDSNLGPSAKYCQIHDLAAAASEMRLINTITREQKEFYHEIPEYAILSHTWDKQELLFDDMKRSDPEGLPGFEKVDKCCKLAASRGFEYVWIDTCCIDKNSSAELQEAINSMYRWYKNAEVCFAYLSDVQSNTNPTKSPAFAASLWFTRGWTLQELIAPRIVEFYGRNEAGDWGEIGTKSSLRDLIAKITGVPIGVLKTGNVANISVATRMSWASRRHTKREEDQAYSLMGIFDVHMTMVYGEGKRAFARLQEEIMKVSNDHSLFAWKSSKRHVRHWTGQGLLADSPADFIHSGQYYCSDHSDGAAAYQITNVGLRIHFSLIPIMEHRSGVEFEEEENIGGEAVTPRFSEYYAVLNCCSESNHLNRLGIVLRLTEDESGDQRGVRCHTREIVDLTPEEIGKARRKVVYITRNREDIPTQQQSPYVDCHISLSITSMDESNVIDAWPVVGADGAIKAKGRESKAILAAVIIKKPPGSNEGNFAVVVGLINGEAWCDVVPDVGVRNAKKLWKTHKYFDQKDRLKKCLDETTSVAVAVRRRGKKFPELQTDKAYTLLVTSFEGDS